MASFPVSLPYIHAVIELWIYRFWICLCVYVRVSERERGTFTAPQVESFICMLRARCLGEKHNTHLLTHSLHPHSPSPSRSFSLDAICPPWYSDALPESRVSAFFPSGPQLPPPCIFNGHTRAADKWFLFLTGEGWLQLHRDGEWGSACTAKNAHTHTHTQTMDTTKEENQEWSSYPLSAQRPDLCKNSYRPCIYFLCFTKHTHTHTHTRTHTHTDTHTHTSHTSHTYPTPTIKWLINSPLGLWWARVQDDERGKKPTKAFIKPGLEPV